MKIGIDISQIAYEGTGVGAYTRNLIAAIAKVDTTNKYIYFASSLRRQKMFQGLGAKVFPFPPTALDFLWNRLHTMPVETLIGSVDVFHTSDWTQPPTKAKKVTTVFDLVVYKYPEISHPKIIETQKRALEWAKKECTSFIAISKATKQDMVEILSIPEEKIKVIYLAAGNDFTNYQLGREQEIKKKYNLAKPYIFAVGTREPRKNQNRLAEALKIANLKDYDLVIAGKPGWGNENLKFEIKNLKILGYVPQEDMAPLYAGAALFVYPSIYEGFGMPVLEAMTVGCPVATSNTSSMPEVGGDAAVYFNPLEVDDMVAKINLALNTSAKLKKLVLNQAKKFSWEKTARETVDVYKNV